MKPMDDRQLQRLVDGELNQAEVRRVLSDARESPAQWQQIALGFVEDQTWDRAFNGLTGNNEDRTETLEVQESNARENSSDALTWRASKPRNSKLNSRLVMAASVLFAAAIGYMASQIQNRTLPKSLARNENSVTATTPRLAQDSIEPVRPTHPTESRPQMTQADYHLELPEEQIGELASAGPAAPVPLFSVKNAEQWKRINQQRRQPAISPEMLKQLTGSGYRMEQELNYISGRLVDGRSFVVPVRTIRFSPGQ